MQESLFTVSLPFVDTDKELENIIAMYPQYDPYFIVSGCVKERREKFDKLWRRYKPCADRHFLNQIRTSFHQRSWEMYIGNVLLAKELSINSENEGPDFIVNNNIYIECVACTKGDPKKLDSVPELKERHVQDIPVDQMILRITQAIKDKTLEQYEKKWKNKRWFKQDMPFVVAINTGDFNYPQDYFGIPLVMKALFGLQFLQISQNGNESFSWREEIKKGNGVPVNYFANENFKAVSGVLFSDNTVLGHPDNIGDDCIFINNPFAQNIIEPGFISLFNNWYAEKENGFIKLTKNY